MKKLILLFTLMAGFAILFVSCETQDDAEVLTEDALYKAKKAKQKVNVCHLDDEGNYKIINISQNALPAHLAHGDMVAFPNVTSFTWEYTIGSTIHPHTMYITEMANGTFSGHGEYNLNPTKLTWDLVEGTYDDEGNVTFTVIFTGEIYNGEIFECTGTFSCGVGASGEGEGITQNAADGTWTISYLGE